MSIRPHRRAKRHQNACSTSRHFYLHIMRRIMDSQIAQRLIPFGGDDNIRHVEACDTHARDGKDLNKVDSEGIARMKRRWGNYYWPAGACHIVRTV